MKKHNPGRLIVGIAFLVLLVGVVGIILLRSRRGIRQDQNTHNAVDNLASVSQQPDEAEGIILGKVPDQPIELVRLELVRGGEQRGNLLMEIENKSEKAVSFVEYALLSMPCRQYDLYALPIEYGVESPEPKKSINEAKKSINKDNTLAPHKKATIRVESIKIDQYLKPTGRASMDCRPNNPWEKPALSLRKVRFADGSVWDISKQAQAPTPVVSGPS
jgi:hypothetical protein